MLVFMCVGFISFRILFPWILFDFQGHIPCWILAELMNQAAGQLIKHTPYYEVLSFKKDNIAIWKVAAIIYLEYALAFGLVRSRL